MCIDMTAVIVIITKMIVRIIVDSQDIDMDKVLPTIVDPRMVVVVTIMACKAVAPTHHSRSVLIICQVFPQSRGIHGGLAPQGPNQVTQNSIELQILLLKSMMLKNKMKRSCKLLENASPVRRLGISLETAQRLILLVPTWKTSRDQQLQYQG
jgi:hypothetical protein